MLDNSVEKIVDAYKEWKEKSKAGRHGSNGNQNTDDNGALSRVNHLPGSQRRTKENAVARKTVQNEAEERQDRERARAARVGETEPPRDPVLRLRNPSAVVEGVEGRGARNIKYTPRFRNIQKGRV
jgi:hypothetical protein